MTVFYSTTLFVRTQQFLLFTCLSKCYTKDRMFGSKQEAAICAFSSDTHIKNIEKNRKRGFSIEKIASFTIDHIKLQPGIYVSRKDHIGADTITTFDLRMTFPK